MISNRKCIRWIDIKLASAATVKVVDSNWDKAGSSFLHFGILQLYTWFCKRWLKKCIPNILCSTAILVKSHRFCKHLHKDVFFCRMNIALLKSFCTFWCNPGEKLWPYIHSQWCRVVLAMSASVSASPPPTLFAPCKFFVIWNIFEATDKSFLVVGDRS